MHRKKFTHYTVLILLFWLLSMVPLNISKGAKLSLTQDEVWSKLQSNYNNILIIDVRSEEYYLEGHIPTAINLPYTDEPDYNYLNIILSYNKSEHIFYCSCVDGISAKSLLTKLSSIGLTNGYYMIDNFLYWPYATVSGSTPGGMSSFYNSSFTESSNTNASPLELTIFFPINVTLTIVTFALIIWRKKK